MKTLTTMKSPTSTNNTAGSDCQERLVRCFCIPAPHPIQRGDVLAYACDEEGKTLSGHYCSSPWWAKQDIMGESHHADYRERYPEGFRLEWIGSPPDDWQDYSANAKCAGTDASENQIPI